MIYTNCLKSISGPEDSIQLQNDINSLCCWSEQWSLLFNSTKTIQISFKPNLQTSYTIGTSSVTKAESHKDLDIILSSNLIWPLGCPLQSNHCKSLQHFGIVKKNFLTSDLHQEQKQLYHKLQKIHL